MHFKGVVLKVVGLDLLDYVLSPHTMMGHSKLAATIHFSMHIHEHIHKMANAPKKLG